MKWKSLQSRQKQPCPQSWQWHHLEVAAAPKEGRLMGRKPHVDVASLDGPTHVFYHARAVSWNLQPRAEREHLWIRRHGAMPRRGSACRYADFLALSFARPVCVDWRPKSKPTQPPSTAGAAAAVTRHEHVALLVIRRRRKRFRYRFRAFCFAPASTHYNAYQDNERNGTRRHAPDETPPPGYRHTNAPLNMSLGTCHADGAR